MPACSGDLEIHLDVSVTRSAWYIFYQIQLNGLEHPPCFKDLQHLEQEGMVSLNLSSFGKKICIYDHTAEHIGVWCPD